MKTKLKLNVELSRFRVKEGKTAKVDEWMAFLNNHMKDTLLTLENEKIYVEKVSVKYEMDVNTSTGILSSRRRDRSHRFGIIHRQKTFRILRRMH